MRSFVAAFIVVWSIVFETTLIDVIILYGILLYFMYKMLNTSVVLEEYNG